MYEFYHLVVLGRVEPWLMARVRTPKRAHLFLRFLPLWLRARIYAAAYVYHLHKQGHVLPGVWKVLQVGPGEIRAAGGLRADDFPVWMQADLRHLAEIEAKLFPKAEFFSRFHRWTPHLAPELGRVYASFLHDLGCDRFEIIVVAPWLREGGADKGTLQYLRYYAKRFASVLLITTYPISSSRLSGVPAEVRVLEIGRAVSRFRMDEQALLLARLMLRLRPALIHNVNSETCWQVFRRHGKALGAMAIKLSASIFIEEKNSAGERVGYSVDYLADCQKVLDAVVTDNRPGAILIQEKYGTEPVRLFPVHFFEQPKPGERRHDGKSASAKVLWASRVCDQKLPWLMLDLARRMTDVEFHMFGVIDPQIGSLENELRGQHNIILHGGYRSFHEVAAHEVFDVFVYTSSFDGVPNVLLEAGAEGFPIVAPVRVGGIADFGDESTVFPVYDNLSVVEYEQAIRLALSNPEEARRRADNARARVAAEFSEQGFERSMDALAAALCLGGRGSGLVPSAVVSAEPADVVLAVPYVDADELAARVLQYADYYRSRDRRLSIVTTLPHDSPWAARLPEDVRLVELGRAAERAGRAATEDDLRVFLERSGARIVHVVQSDLGWRTIAKFGRELRGEGVVFAGSLFVREPLGGGETTGYADRYLAGCRDVLDWVITDNTVLSRELVADFDVGERRVRTVHFWVDTAGGRRAAMDQADPEDGPILWAGRICRQKNPELLLDVARRLAHRQFRVYGEADDAGRAVVEALRACPNVALMGRFESFDRIAQQERYGCLLYTTLFDGLPNVILEAAAAGIPIVAPASVGGLSDFVDAQTAFVVADAHSGAEIAATVEGALRDARKRRLCAEAAFDRVAEHFGRAAFLQRMDALFAAGAETKPAAP